MRDQRCGIDRFAIGLRMQRGVAVLGFQGSGKMKISSWASLDRIPKWTIWAAAGPVDTDLSFLSFLELYGTEIAERRMPARRVVEAFDVVEHV